MGVRIVIILLILVLKMTKKYTHNMILMSRYKGQLHGGKKGQRIRAGVSPPFSGNARKKKILTGDVPLSPIDL